MFSGLYEPKHGSQARTDYFFPGHTSSEPWEKIIGPSLTTVFWLIYTTKHGIYIIFLYRGVV